ncbi:MAG TPA: hypothetical protein VGL63_07415 [Streptosporangiaceae bacterium]
MGITQPPPATTAKPAPAGHTEAFVTGGAYAMLFLFGLAVGVVSSFQYSRAVIGSVPLAALGCCVLILLTCGLGGRAMRTVPGALLPAVGWFLAAFGLAMPNSGGSVIIANTTAGEWFLYGGSVCALLGVGSAVVASIRTPR